MYIFSTVKVFALWLTAIQIVAYVAFFWIDYVPKIGYKASL